MSCFSVAVIKILFLSVTSTVLTMVRAKETACFTHCPTQALPVQQEMGKGNRCHPGAASCSWPPAAPCWGKRDLWCASTAVTAWSSSFTPGSWSRWELPLGCCDSPVRQGAVGERGSPSLPLFFPTFCRFCWNNASQLLAALWSVSRDFEWLSVGLDQLHRCLSGRGLSPSSSYHSKSVYFDYSFMLPTI